MNIRLADPEQTAHAVGGQLTGVHQAADGARGDGEAERHGGEAEQGTRGGRGSGGG